MKIIIIILLLIIILINLIYNKNSSHSTIIKQPIFLQEYDEPELPIWSYGYLGPAIYDINYNGKGKGQSHIININHNGRHQGGGRGGRGGKGGRGGRGDGPGKGGRGGRGDGPGKGGRGGRGDGPGKGGRGGKRQNISSNLGNNSNSLIIEQYTSIPMKQFEKEKDVNVLSNNNVTTDPELPKEFQDDIIKGNQTLNSALNLLGQ
jgi:hypothetical protein